MKEKKFDDVNSVEAMRNYYEPISAGVWIALALMTFVLAIAGGIGIYVYRIELVKDWFTTGWICAVYGIVSVGLLLGTCIERCNYACRTLDGYVECVRKGAVPTYHRRSELARFYSANFGDTLLVPLTKFDQEIRFLDAAREVQIRPCHSGEYVLQMGSVMYQHCTAEDIFWWLGEKEHGEQLATVSSLRNLQPVIGNQRFDRSFLLAMLHIVNTKLADRSKVGGRLALLELRRDVVGVLIRYATDRIAEELTRELEIVDAEIARKTARP